MLRLLSYLASIATLFLVCTGCPILNECGAFDGHSFYGYKMENKQVELTSIPSGDTVYYTIDTSIAPGVLVHIAESDIHCKESDWNYISDLFFNLDTAAIGFDTITYTNAELIAINCAYRVDYSSFGNTDYEIVQHVSEGYITCYKSFSVIDSVYSWLIDAGIVVKDLSESSGQRTYHYFGNLEEL